MVWYSIARFFLVWPGKTMLIPVYWRLTDSATLSCSRPKLVTSRSSGVAVIPEESPCPVQMPSDENCHYVLGCAMNLGWYQICQESLGEHGDDLEFLWLDSRGSRLCEIFLISSNSANGEIQISQCLRFNQVIAIKESSILNRDPSPFPLKVCLESGEDFMGALVHVFQGGLGFTKGSHEFPQGT